MLNKSQIFLFMFICFLIGESIFATIGAYCSDHNFKLDQDTYGNLRTGNSEEKPFVIWYHNVHRDPPEAIKKAISSRLITHVMVKSLHRYDFNYLLSKNTLKAIKIVKDSDVKLIWSRTIWPVYSISESKSNDLFSVDYYVREIKAIRSEAANIDAEFVAIDIEAYGDSPIKKYTRNRVLSKKEMHKLNVVIDNVVN
jgi:hypothetical protein